MPMTKSIEAAIPKPICMFMPPLSFAMKKSLKVYGLVSVPLVGEKTENK